MPIQQSVKEILMDAREIIDGEMNCHTPEYRALDKLERALDQLCGEVSELNGSVFPLRDR